MAPIDSGPLAGCNIDQNGNCADPNLQPGRSTGNNTFITISKEIHTLNDAILAAAKELSTRLKERRRIIYVVTDSDIYAEGGVNSIEKGCAKIAEEARTQCTLGYLSHKCVGTGLLLKQDSTTCRSAAAAFLHGCEVTARRTGSCHALLLTAIGPRLSLYYAWFSKPFSPIEHI